MNKNAKDLREFEGKAVWYDGKIWDIKNIDFNNVTLTSGKLKNSETATVLPQNCITKNNSDFFNMTLIENVVYDDAFDCKCIKLIYETVNSKVTDLFNNFKGTNSAPLQLPNSD